MGHQRLWCEWQTAKDCGQTFYLKAWLWLWFCCHLVEVCLQSSKTWHKARLPPKTLCYPPWPSSTHTQSMATSKDSLLFPLTLFHTQSTATSKDPLLSPWPSSTHKAWLPPKTLCYPHWRSSTHKAWLPPKTLCYPPWPSSTHTQSKGYLQRLLATPTDPLPHMYKARLPPKTPCYPPWPSSTHTHIKHGYLQRPFAIPLDHLPYIKHGYLQRPFATSLDPLPHTHTKHGYLQKLLATPLDPLPHTHKARLPPKTLCYPHWPSSTHTKHGVQRAPAFTYQPVATKRGMG